ncbi:MAG: tripartite tricarboxylate transporter TctB family protein [Deltaproteobacteria bacterium]
MKRGEQILGAVLLLFAIYIGYESTMIETGASSSNSGIGAGFMPFWLSVGLGISSMVLLGRAVVLPADRFTPGFFIDRTGRMRVVWVFAGYLLAVVVMKPLGMMISLAILMATTMPAFGSRSWKSIILTTILTPICVYLVFGYWLKVDLPMGIFENVLSIY